MDRSATPPIILAIDIGGTKSMVGIVDSLGRVLSHERIETPNCIGPNCAISAISNAAERVIRKSGLSPDVIGIGCGGPMDRKSGVLGRVSNLPDWEGISLTRTFGDQFGAPTYVDNDATAMALGEHLFGAGRGVRNIAFLTVSTGIGGGIIIEGKLYRGENDNAAEFGHHKVRPDGPRCPCGDYGCLEALASGTSVARIAKEGLAAGACSLIRDWVNETTPVTAEMVSRAAGFGDTFSRQIWEQAMLDLGLGITNIINILNPKLVVIGGGMTNAGELLFEPVRKVVRERAMKPIADIVEIVRATNGDLCGLLGAAAIALESTDQRL